MRTWKQYCAGLALCAGLTPSLWAQIPAAPVAPAPAAAAPVAGVPAAPAGPNLFTFFCIPADKKAECKECLCSIPLFKAMSSGFGAVGGLTGLGGPPLCPDPLSKPEALAKPSTSAEGAAARIKKDTAEAKERAAAARYLGTVDCHYWPEAEEALIKALREDRNECVRLAAAQALGNGCCCTKKTIHALALTVAASNKDGNPSETCERVRAAAYFALTKCLACYEEIVPAEKPTLPSEKPKLPSEKPQEKPKLPTEKPPVVMEHLDRTQAYFKRLESVQMADVVRDAHQVVVHTGYAPKAVSPAHVGERSMFRIVTNSVNTSVSQPIPVTPKTSSMLLPRPGETAVAQANVVTAEMNQPSSGDGFATDRPATEEVRQPTATTPKRSKFKWPWSARRGE